MNSRCKLGVWLFVLMALGTGAAQDREVLVGYNDNPPQMYRDGSGRPTGFVVDAFNEAARREGLQLRWVWVEPGQAFPWLRTGKIQLWPAGVSTPERRREFHLNEPWWRGQAVILSRSLHFVSDLAGRRIAHTPSTTAAVRTHLTQIIPIEMANTTEMAQALCRDELDGILIDRLVLDTLLLKRPAVCNGLTFDIVVDVGVMSEMGIIAGKSHAQVADRLRGRLSDAASDGTLAALALSYPRISAASADFVATMVEQRYRLQTLQTVLAAFVALLAAAVYFIWRLRTDLRLRRRAQEQLRQRNSDLEQFAYASHHDLQEPLRNVSLFGQLIQRKGLDDPEAPNHLQHITSGAERMQRMLDAVRDYTDVAISSSGERTVVDAGAALLDARQNLMVQLTEAGATIETGKLPQVPFVREHLVQVLQNLLSNAAKYRGPEPLRIRVDCRVEGNDYVFSVQDNGIGIAPEYHERVFGVFRRLHGRGIPGAGIGLAICQKIVDNHGGRIWVESTPGHGSTFYFTVPRSTAKSTRLRKRGAFVAQ